MRRFITGLCLGLCFLTQVGCENLPWRRKDPKDIGQITTNAKTPSSAALVAYLNRNARKVSGVQCNNVTLQVSMDSQSAVLNSAKLFAQKPRDLRMTAKIISSPGVDLGSNSNEFWYWISKDPNYGDVVFHCSHEDLARGARSPFPFQPEMIMAALGVAEYDAQKQYEVRAVGDTFELIEPPVTIQGKQVQKVTVFNKRRVSGRQPQVIAHILRDAQGKDITTAKVIEVQEIKSGESVARLPRRIEVTWPAEKVKMKMKLDGLKAVTFSPQRASLIFSRDNLSGTLRAFNIGSGEFDGIRRADMRGPRR